MGDQKAHQAPEPEAKPAATQAAGPMRTAEPADRAEGALLSSRLGSTLAGAGSPPSDASVLDGPGLYHPTGARQRIALTRTLQRRQGNAFVQRAVLQARSATDVSEEAVRRAMADRSPGRPLDPAVQLDLEPRFGRSFADVRVHTDTKAAQLARGLNAQAFTRGQDIYFGAGQYAPTTSGGRHLLAHELAHVVQQAPNGDLRRCPSNQVGATGDRSERQAETAARLVTSGRRVSVEVVRQVPALQRTSIGEQLDSDDPAVRGAALHELAARTDESAWRAILLAQESRHEDVRTETEAIIRRWFSEEAGFETFVRDLAAIPRGALSDLAVHALAAQGEGEEVSLENYRAMIHQRLDLARQFMSEADQELYETISVALGHQPPRSEPFSTAEIDTLQAQVDVLPIENLWEVGLRASTLLERLGLARAALQDLRERARQMPEGALRELIERRAVFVLLSALQFTGEETDPAFDRMVEQLESLQGDFAATLVESIYSPFTQARSELQSAMEREPLPSFRNAWNNFRAEVMAPLDEEFGVLIAEIEFLRPVAKENPDAVFGQLQNLEPNIQSIGERVLYTLQATNMMDLYHELALTDEAAKDVMLQTEQALKLLFAHFAELAHRRDRDPETVHQLYEDLLQSDLFQDAVEDIQTWNEILAGELAFAQFLLDVLIVIASIYTAGLAAEVYIPLRALLGVGARTLIGRVAIGLTTFAARVTAFHLTSRGLRWAIYGEEFAGEDFWRQYGETAILFAILEGSGQIFRRFISPRVPVPLRGAAQFTLTFSVFQAWAVGVTRWETGEWLGPTDERFWRLAAHNAVFLAAVHLGLAITKPLNIPMSLPEEVQSRLDQHHRNGRELKARIDAWRNTETPNEAEALKILQRTRELFRERIEVMRALNEHSPTLLTAEELAQAELFLQEQIAATEAAELQVRVRMRPHETDPSTFYYEGEPAEIVEFYRPRGFEVVAFDPATGRLQMWDPAGEMIQLIRSGAREGTRGLLVEATEEARPDVEQGLEALRDFAEVSPETAQAMEVELAGLDPAFRAGVLEVLGKLRPALPTLEVSPSTVVAIARRAVLQELPPEALEPIVRELEPLDFAEREVRLDEIEEMVLLPETVPIPTIETTDLGTYVRTHPGESFRGFRQALLDYADEFAGGYAPLEAQIRWMREYFADGSPAAVNLRINSFKGMMREVSDRVLAEETGYTDIIPDRAEFPTPLGTRRMDLSGISPFGVREYLETKYSNIDISRRDLTALEESYTVWELLDYIDTNYTSVGRRPSHVFREIVKDLYLIETQNLSITWKVNTGPSDLSAILNRWGIHYITYQ
ncbi:MAG: DUF4157 domain-containing protein [Anaerolineae bacterium]